MANHSTGCIHVVAFCKEHISNFMFLQSREIELLKRTVLLSLITLMISDLVHIIFNKKLWHNFCDYIPGKNLKKKIQYYVRWIIWRAWFYSFIPRLLNNISSTCDYVRLQMKRWFVKNELRKVCKDLIVDKLRLICPKISSIEWGSSVRFEHRIFWKNRSHYNFTIVWRM